RVALLREKRLEQTLLGASHRPIHLSRQSLAGAGQPRKHHASVVRAAAALQEPTSRKAGEDVGDLCAVDSEVPGPCILIEIGVERERRQQSVLNRCDVESRAFLEEQRVVDLMQAPQKIAGPPPQRHVGMDRAGAQRSFLGLASPGFPFAGESLYVFSCRLHSCHHWAASSSHQTRFSHGGKYSVYSHTCTCPGLC